MISDKIQSKIRKIKFVATDIDGVWTDAQMHYNPNDEYMKSYSTYDGYAVQLLKEAGIEVAILTSANSKFVRPRAEKLKVEYLYTGERNKLKRIEYLCAKLGFTLDEVAFIGDDLNDVETLKVVGLSAMPGNSPVLHLLEPDIITDRYGGNGAFREFADLILQARQVLERISKS